jgi:serine/threonine-protein kinase
MLARDAMKDHGPLLGRTIAERYRLIATLGSGGMATVYLARHVLIDRLSAIKVLHTELDQDPVGRDRFLREARAVNRINHPNIVEITDYGEADGLAYLVMEYVPGESLGRLLDRGAIGWKRAAAIGVQIASALGRAHQMGVIHRDLKPTNVLVLAQRDGADLIKLTDFGVAKMLDAPSLTTSTIALGTPGYLAPEYVEFGQLGPRADLFALGVILYEAVSGTLPFAVSADAPSSSTLAEPVPLSTRAPSVPRAFAEVIATLLARDPDDLPRDGFEAADLLRRALQATEPSGSAASAEGADPAQPRRRGPHLTTVAFDQIEPLCVRALQALEEATHEREALVAPDVSPEATVALGRAREQVGRVATIAALIGEDTRAVEGEEARARDLRAELGRRIDELAMEHSKALGWAGTLAERGDVVRARRSSGDEPVASVEAMVWEQAALDEEADQTRHRLGELDAELGRLQAALEQQSAALEHAQLVATARLEGHVAALRVMALDAWMALELAATHWGVELAC